MTVSSSTSGGSSNLRMNLIDNKHASLKVITESPEFSSHNPSIDPSQTTSNHYLPSNSSNTELMVDNENFDASLSVLEGNDLRLTVTSKQENHKTLPNHQAL